MDFLRRAINLKQPGRELKTNREASSRSGGVDLGASAMAMSLGQFGNEL